MNYPAGSATSIDLNFHAPDDYTAWWGAAYPKLRNHSIYSKGAVIWNAALARATPQHPDQKPVAYLHQVVAGDGEPDQALSFAPDNFPLANTLGYRSVGYRPLFDHPATPQHSVTEHASINIDKLRDLAEAYRYAPLVHKTGERSHTDVVLDALAEFVVAARPVAANLLNADELAALRRFDECAQDGEGWDVPKEMMQRLAEIGVVRRKSGNFYEATDFGQAVLAQSLASTAATQPEQASIPALPGCLADRLYEAIDIARDRAEHAGSTSRVQKWKATAADLRAALAIPASAKQDVCAEMRALCSACGGTGDVHSIDGEWRGSCDCRASTAASEQQAEAECPTCLGSGYTDAGDPETGATKYDYPCTDCAALTHRATTATYTVDGVVMSPLEYIDHLHTKLGATTAADQQGDTVSAPLDDAGELARYREWLEANPTSALQMIRLAQQGAAQAQAGDVAKPCRNAIINSGRGAWPKSCQRCGLAKNCPDGVVEDFKFAAMAAPATSTQRQGAPIESAGPTLFGLPIVIDDSVAPGQAEFRSGRRTVAVDIQVDDAQAPGGDA
jgi:hypothetical protein